MRLTHAKPNPTGKDKAGEKPKIHQLLAEWVVINNNRSTRIEQSKLALAHTEFDKEGKPKPKPVIYWQGKEKVYLEPGETLRVHAGKAADAASMLTEDKEGVTKHSFSEDDKFVLNNDQADTVYLYEIVDSAYSLVDSAYYDKNPPEGKVLVRKGDKFEPPTQASAAGGLAPARGWADKHTIGPSGKSA